MKTTNILQGSGTRATAFVVASPTKKLKLERTCDFINDTQKQSLTLPVYNMRLAGFLMTKGFVLLSLAPNERDTRKNVFYFGNSEAINQAISSYLKSR